MSSAHSHHHHHHDDDEDSERKTRLVVAITLVMMTIEVSAGIFTKSMALLADGCSLEYGNRSRTLGAEFGTLWEFGLALLANR